VWDVIWRLELEIPSFGNYFAFFFGKSGLDMRCEVLETTMDYEICFCKAYMDAWRLAVCCNPCSHIDSPNIYTSSLFLTQSIS
jgi:hypothetical protein